MGGGGPSWDVDPAYPESRTCEGRVYMSSRGSVNARWPLLKEFGKAFLIPVTKPPTNRLSGGDSSFIEPPSEKPASVGPAVARNGTPG